MTSTQLSLISEIRAYAVRHYDDSKVSWDTLVECYSDEEILAEIGRARTLAGAIKKLAPALRTLRSVHNDVLAAGGLPPVGTEREREIDTFVAPHTPEELAAIRESFKAEKFQPGDVVVSVHPFENPGCTGMVRTSWINSNGDREYDVLFVNDDGEVESGGAINTTIELSETALGRFELLAIKDHLDRIPGNTNRVLIPLVARLLAEPAYLSVSEIVGGTIDTAEYVRGCAPETQWFVWSFDPVTAADSYLASLVAEYGMQVHRKFTTDEAVTLVTSRLPVTTGAAHWLLLEAVTKGTPVGLSARSRLVHTSGDYWTHIFTA